MAFVDDGGVVGVVGQRRIKPTHGLGIRLDKGLHAIFRYQHIIRCHAGLPGVQGFAEGDAFGGVLERHIGRNNRRRFAAQLQGHWREVFGRRTHHMLAYAGSTGEQELIEAQLGKRHAHVGFAQHDAHQVLGEDLGQQSLEQFTGGGRGLAELEHHPVTGSQRPH